MVGARTSALWTALSTLGGWCSQRSTGNLQRGFSGLKLSWNVGGSSFIQLAALGSSGNSASESLTAGAGGAGAASHSSQACSRCSGNTSSTNQLMKRETGGWLPSQARGSWTAWRWPGGALAGTAAREDASSSHWAPSATSGCLSPCSPASVPWVQCRHLVSEKGALETMRQKAGRAGNVGVGMCSVLTCPPLKEKMGGFWSTFDKQVFHSLGRWRGDPSR